MFKRLRITNSRELSYPIAGMVAFLLLLTLASFQVANAQSAPNPAETRKEARPLFIERSQFVDGKRDPRLRLEFLFAEPRENCTAWRFETSVQSNGHAIFELKEPGDKKVVLSSDFGERHLEFVLGDADCSYRVRIERIK
jgi:hypothetical protein